MLKRTELDWVFYDDLETAWTDFLQGKRINIVWGKLAAEFEQRVYGWGWSAVHRYESEGTTVDGQHVNSWYIT